MEYQVNNLTDRINVSPFKMTVMINGKELKMELDTGASVSLVSLNMFNCLWPEMRF